MKKFKNEFGVVADSEALLKAFKEEVEKLGWVYDETFTYWDDSNLSKYKCLYFSNTKGGGLLDSNKFSISSPDKNTQRLPQDWNRALKLASELEEEVPEYIKLINTGSFISDCSYTQNNPLEPNKIYKVSTKTPTSMYPIRFVLELENGLVEIGYNKGEVYSISSTKAAYDAQQQELADKELLEKLIRESGLKIGDKVERADDENVYTIEKFILVTSKPNSSILVEKEWDKLKKPFIYFISGAHALPVNKVVKFEKPKTLTLGSSNIKIKIFKSKIEATGREFNISWIKAVLGNMKGGFYGDFAYYCPKITIGCSTFTLAELEQVVATYNELNK